jgi:hypothetical protein
MNSGEGVLTDTQEPAGYDKEDPDSMDLVSPKGADVD